MIDINLIPQALRKNSQSNLNAININFPKEILVGVGVGVILLLVSVHLLLGIVWVVDAWRLSSYKARWEQVLPDKSVLDGIYKESSELRNKTSMLAEMTTKISAPWAPKLNAISDAVTRGLWIKKMALVDKVGLTIEGSVVSKNKSEVNNVDKFLSALRENELFMKGFSSLEVNSIQRGKNNAVEVTDFTVMAKLIEQVNDKSKPKSK